MLIHCTMDELLAIRQGEGSVAALDHLDDCDECREEMERIHQRVAALKALPTIAPPRDRWPVVREEILADRRSKRRTLVGWLSMAAAASVAFAVGVSQLVPAMQAAGDEPDPYLVLLEEATTLEDALRVLELESRVLNGRTASALVVLEDQLRLLDARLGEARVARVPRDDVIRLMRQRVDIMDAIVDVRQARGVYVRF